MEYRDDVEYLVVFKNTNRALRAVTSSGYPGPIEMIEEDRTIKVILKGCGIKILEQKRNIKPESVRHYYRNG